MSTPDGQERRATSLGKLLEGLHNPTHLRVFLMLVVLGIGYAVVYMPFEERNADVTKKLAEAKKRLNLADEVKQLRKQFGLVEGRLAQQTDANEWMQYVLGGLRDSPLKMTSFTPGASQTLGPYQVVTLNLRLSGDYSEVDKFLYWLESNERLFRVDGIRISASLSDKGLDINVDLTVVGVIG